VAGKRLHPEVLDTSASTSAAQIFGRFRTERSVRASRAARL